MCLKEPTRTYRRSCKRWTAEGEEAEGGEGVDGVGEGVVEEGEDVEEADAEENGNLALIVMVTKNEADGDGDSTLPKQRRTKSISATEGFLLLRYSMVTGHREIFVPLEQTKRVPLHEQPNCFERKAYSVPPFLKASLVQGS